MYVYQHHEKGSVLTFEGLISVEDVVLSNNERTTNPRLQGADYLIVDYLKADLSRINRADAVIPAGFDYAHSKDFPLKTIVIVAKDPHTLMLIEKYEDILQKMAPSWERCVRVESLEEAFMIVGYCHPEKLPQ